MTIDPNTKEKAEKIIESLSRLAAAIEEGMIFRFLHAESLGAVAGLGSKEDFDSRIGIRAGLARSEVANIFAMTQGDDGKGKLGSLGFIFGLMNKDRDLQALLLSDRNTGYLPDRSTPSASGHSTRASSPILDE